MPNTTDLFTARTSAMNTSGTLAGDVNARCHGFTGGVQPNNKHIMRNPRVFLILWDHFYRTNPDAVSFATQLVTDLITGSFMNGLVQYGVGPGSLAGSLVVDTDAANPAPNSWDISDDAQKDKLKGFINGGIVSPSENETELIYLILLPRATKITAGKDNNGKPITNVCGWHKHARFNSNSSSDDLFWAVVRTDGATTTSEKAFVNGVAFCVGHELVEAFSDRDEQGFKSPNCEIGDICEADSSGKIITFSYRGWDVEPYWSNWDNSCINGDQPVNLRDFLKAINFDVSQGLSALNAPVINLQFMATRLP
jgi:hypothetical protein